MRLLLGLFVVEAPRITFKYSSLLRLDPEPNLRRDTARDFCHGLQGDWLQLEFILIRTGMYMIDRKRAPWVILVLSAGLLLCLTLFRICISLPRGSGLTHESGVLSGLAMDYRDGVLYRPLIGPLGYGGTRYGALHIFLQGSLMRLGIPTIASGHAIAIVSIITLAFALCSLLIQLDVPKQWAACCTMLLLAGASGQYAVTTIRVDLLSASLSFCGLFCCVVVLKRTKGSVLLLIFAAVFFALAIFTKITDGFGLISAVIVFLFARRWRDAITLTAITGIFSIAGLLAFNALSHGRMLENFRACANGGRAPLHIQQWVAILYDVLIRGDWTGTLLMLTALAAWIVAPVNSKRSLPGILLIVSIGMTLPLYFSPGLSVNQLIDAEVAAALFLGYQIFQTQKPSRWICIATALCLCCVVQFMRPKILMECFYRRTDALRKAAESDGPILSDHALIPVVAGQSPFLLDDFTFPAVRKAHPEAQLDLYQRLDEGYFAVVVLRHQPPTGENSWALGKDFTAKLQQRYVLVSHTTYWDQLWVFHRR